MPDELEEKVLDTLQAAKDSNMLQSDLWKTLNLSSREVSRSLARLERRGVVKREPFREGGRKTYRVTLLKKKPKVSFTDVQWCACFTCPDLDRCGKGQPISPETCVKLTASIKEDYNRLLILTSGGADSGAAKAAGTRTGAEEAGGTGSSPEELRRGS